MRWNLEALRRLNRWNLGWVVGGESGRGEKNDRPEIGAAETDGRWGGLE